MHSQDQTRQWSPSPTTPRLRVPSAAPTPSISLQIPVEASTTTAAPTPSKAKKKSLSKEKRVGIEDHIVESNSAISSRHFEEFNSASIIMLKLSILKNRFILICIFFLYVHIIYKFLIIQINVLNVF